MRAHLAVCLLLGVPGLASALCSAPTPPASIPSGASATRGEMTRAQRDLVEFDAAVGTYRECVLGELTQKRIGRSAEEQRALGEEMTRPYMELWTKLHWMTDCFNAELGTFRTTGGGKKATPADCSSYVPRAMEAASAPPPSVPPGTPAFSEPQTVPHGVWYYRVVRSEQLKRCRFRGAPSCTEARFEVANRSNRILECRAQAQLSGNNNEGVSHLEMPGVVPPGSTRALLTTLLPGEVAVSSSTATCEEREPLGPLEVPAECHFQIARPVSVSDYYPTLSRRLGEQGPVALHFVLAQKEGKATNIEVIGSSLFERVDAAAVKAVGDIVFTTACPGHDFRMQLLFDLD